MQFLSRKKLLILRPDEIKPSKSQSRSIFKEEEIKKLSNSISRIGIIQPISVRKNNGGYEVISGERRLRAAVKAGIRRVPCVVHNIDEKQAAIYSIAENLYNAPLNFFEIAKSINELIIRYRLTLCEAALRLGISEEELSRKLKILRLDEALINKLIGAGLDEEYANLLLRIEEEKREDILSIIIANNFGIKKCEQKIEEILNPKPIDDEIIFDKDEPIRKTMVGDMRIFTNSLEKLVGIAEKSNLDIEFRKNESGKYIEYKFKIKKEEQSSNYCKQLKIC